MTTAYPGALDTFTNPGAGSLVTSPSHSAQHANINDAMAAVQATLGTTGGTSVLKNFTAGKFAEREGTLTFGANRYSLGTAALSQGSALFYNGTNIVGSAVTSFTSPLTTKGDLFTYTSVDARLAVGTAGQFLISSPGAATGLAWTSSPEKAGLISATGGGTPSILQITSGTATDNRILRLDSTQAVGLGWSNNWWPTKRSLVDDPGGTISLEIGGGNAFLTLGTTAGNRTIDGDVSATGGRVISLAVKQNAAATGTIVFNSDFRTPAITQGTAGTWNYYVFQLNDIDSKWDFMYQSVNLI